jgi:hypothetical protein
MILDRRQGAAVPLAHPAPFVGVFMEFQAELCQAFPDTGLKPDPSRRDYAR